MHGRPLHPDPTVRPDPTFQPVQRRTQIEPLPWRSQEPLAQPGREHAHGEPSFDAQDTVDYAIATRLKKVVADRLADLLKDNPGMSPQAQAQRGRALINEAVAVWSDAAAIEHGRATTPAEDRRLAEAVYDLLFRAGRLQKYLDDPRVENILVNGHDDVSIDYGDARRVQVPPVAESDEDLKELLRDLARRTGQSERTLSTANPFLALRLEDGSRLQAITEVTPKTYVTIRRHRVRDIDLPGLVELGSIDTTLAAFLGALIRAKKNVMIVGTQGVGKTSLLRAMAREIPPDERIGTMETEYELFLHENGHHRQIVPMESRIGNGERVDGHSVGEITVSDLIYPALRMTLSRMVVGEVRGPEVVPMLRVMTNGEGGSLCTLHAREPHMVFDRIAELYMEYGGNMTESLAYKQAANGINFIVFVKMIDETAIGGTRHRFVSHVLEVTGTGESGRPATNTVFGPNPELDEPRAVPLMHPACLPDLMRVGFPAHLLDLPRGTWQAPLELKVRAA
ncbi:CpaF family protein [Streptomyces sp. ISL-22]|nr:CpaF family protein [Streptomyces sp. ISL-24]MBT2432309.1 CpaF family protein [Streptomyces sp. ISL-22]